MTARQAAEPGTGPGADEDEGIHQQTMEK